MTTEAEESPCLLGKMIVNLQSLEHALRIYLAKRPGARPLGIPYGTDIYELPLGTTLDQSDLTSYDTLGQLVAQFNAEMARQGKPGVDRRLIDLRDALAHGRVSARENGDVLRLVKFSKPDKQGKVRVVFREEMTVNWLSAQMQRIHAAALMVFAEMERLPESSA